MREFLSELFSNRILIAAIVAWAAAQLIKTIIYLILYREWRFERLVGSGGMPSSHAATVCALSVSALLHYGVGSPVFGKLQAQLAAAMMGIPAAKGFEYGDGFAAAAARGSEQLDTFIPDGKGGITVASNHSGGIQGGITNGAPIVFRVAFKPIATMPGRAVETVDRNGRPATVTYSGRHDVCAVPRALPVVEAMANLVLLDVLLA